MSSVLALTTYQAPSSICCTDTTVSGPSSRCCTGTMAVPSPVSIGPPSTSSVNPSTSVAKARAADVGASKRRQSPGDGQATAKGSTVGEKVIAVVVEVVVSTGTGVVVTVSS